MIYLFCSVSNLYCYAAFRSLKSVVSKNNNLLKPRYIESLKTRVLSSRVFACIGDREAKNGDFMGKIAKLEKVRYGSDGEVKGCKASKYWDFEGY